MKIEPCMDSNMIPRDYFAIITFGTCTWNTDQMFGYHYHHLKSQTPVHEYVKKPPIRVDSNMTSISIEDQSSARNWATVKPIVR